MSHKASKPVFFERMDERSFVSDLVGSLWSERLAFYNSSHK